MALSLWVGLTSRDWQRSFAPNPVRTSAMLNQTSAGGGWGASVGDWMVIDLGDATTIVGFMTQARGAHYCSTPCSAYEGCVTCNSWVTSAKVQYKVLPDDDYTELPTTFDCNVVGDVLETVTNIFAGPKFARYIKIIPQTCHGGCWMRAAIVTTAPAKLLFTVPVSISAVSPTSSGFGGGTALTISGQGFHTDNSRVSVTVCGTPCIVTSSSLTSVVCAPQLYVDTPKNPVISATMDIPLKDGANDATVDTITNALVASTTMVGGYINRDKPWSKSRILLRFELDVVGGSHIKEANFQVRSADSACQKDTVIRIWGEFSDHSEPLEAANFNERPRTESSVDWTTTEDWRCGEAKESADVSVLLNEIVARPGWRAGNAILLILQQKGASRRSCNMFSYEYDRKYSARLRLKIGAAASLPLVLPTSQICPITTAVSTEKSETDLTVRCKPVRLRTTATSSSADIPSMPLSPDAGAEYPIRGLYKSILHKVPDEVLHWQEARSRCSAIGARLCRNHEVMEEGIPFFGFQDAVDSRHVFVPTEVLSGDQPGYTHTSYWLDVSRDYPADIYGQGSFNSPSWEAKEEENIRRTNLIPCCSVVGHPPYMAVDQFTDSFWDSGQVAAANLTLMVHDAKTVDRIEVVWTQDYAQEYRLLIRNESDSDSHFIVVKEEYAGQGGLTRLTLPRMQRTGLGLEVLLEMTVPAYGRSRYGVADISALGCAPVQCSSAVTGMRNLGRSCGKDCLQGCPAYQSSYYGDHGPDKSNAPLAVDGETNAYFHTECNRKNEWFMVDLEKEASIQSVTIQNRADIPSRCATVYFFLWWRRL